MLIGSQVTGLFDSATVKVPDSSALAVRIHDAESTAAALVIKPDRRVSSFVTSECPFAYSESVSGSYSPLSHRLSGVEKQQHQPEQGNRSKRRAIKVTGSTVINA
jgi:hypothetical protein